MKQSSTAKKLSSEWTSVDAAIDWGNGQIYFFKGNQYIAFDKVSRAVPQGYPLTIASEWHGVVFDRVDAAIMWPGGRYAYLFCGDEYCRYNVAANKVDPGFERLKIKDHWKGIPFNKIDSALLWPDNKSVLFFSGNEYCRFDIAANKVAPDFERRKVDVDWKGLTSQGVRAALLGTPRDAYFFHAGLIDLFDISRVWIFDSSNVPNLDITKPLKNFTIYRKHQGTYPRPVSLNFNFSNLDNSGWMMLINKSGFITRLEVSYTMPDGKTSKISHFIGSDNSRTIPIPTGAKNIEVGGFAVAGKAIFRRVSAGPRIWNWEVGGTTLAPTFKEK
jgi:hypothetical protein